MGRGARWLLAAAVNNRQPCGRWARMGEGGDRMGCPGWERSRGGRGAKGLVHTLALLCDGGGRTWSLGCPGEEGMGREGEERSGGAL